MAEQYVCMPKCDHCAAKVWNTEIHDYICSIEGGIFRREYLGSYRRTFVPPTDCPQGYTSGGMDNLTQQNLSDGGRRPATQREILDAIKRVR